MSKMAMKSNSILDSFPEYEVMIGMEVHVQLTTKSKIFCSCANVVGKDPNVNICVICAGYPGSLPVLNQQVIDYAIVAGLATHSIISCRSSFDRKHYFYPDLPKGYQITQQYEPICKAGYIPIRLENGTTKNIHLTRIHIEEDAGKNIHSAMSNESFVDLNRAGTPLLEIVSEPDISSAYETKAYLKALRSIVQYLGICSGNMEEGAFRADTNISVRKKGSTIRGTKCELKNINSFKFIGDAVEYEIERQIKLVQQGDSVHQETRLWDSNNKCTILMRTKEEAADYRYFGDPDLPMLLISDERINVLKSTMPEMPYAKFERLCREFELSAYEAEILVEDKELADYFDEASRHTTSKQLVHWILRDLMGYVKEHKISVNVCKVTPEKLASIITMIELGVISSSAAKKIFDYVADTGQDPHVILQLHGLQQISSADELGRVAREIIASNPAQVEQYKKTGNERMLGFFVGKAMQKTHGKGNPAVFTELFVKLMS